MIEHDKRQAHVGLLAEATRYRPKSIGIIEVDLACEAKSGE